MLFALLLQELFLLKIVKFARPTILILFTFHGGAIKWMGKKENYLCLLYKTSFKVFSKMSSTFTAEVLWICSHMLHVLASPLKQIQVITQLSTVYMVICVCLRLLSRRLVGVWHSAASELPCTSHYLTCFQQPLCTHGLLHRTRAGGAHFRLTEVPWSGLSKGWVYVVTMQHWADILGEDIIWLEFTSFLSTVKAPAREEITLRITSRSLFWHQWHQLLGAQGRDTH